MRKKSVIVVIGVGSIGQAIARSVSAGKHVLLADLRHENATSAAKILQDAGFEVSTAVVDVSSRASVHALVETVTAIGDVTGLIHAAGVSPSQASVAGRAATPDEVGTLGALLMGADGAFTTGSVFLMDGGVTSSYWYGDLAPQTK